MTRSTAGSRAAFVVFAVAAALGALRRPAALVRVAARGAAVTRRDAGSGTAAGAGRRGPQDHRDALLRRATTA